MTVFTPQALLNLKKFRKKGKKDNSRNPNPKTPEMMGDTKKFTKKENSKRLSKADIERLRERLKSQSQIPKFPIGPGPSDNNYKREPFRPKPKVQPMRRKKMGGAIDYKKYLKTLKKITKPKGMDDLTRSRVGQFTIAGRIKKLLKKRTGGAMLKNPGKADLDKDGKLSGYEKKRGMAIEKSMSGKRFGGAIKGFGAARRKGMGLQDEMFKPGKVMNAKRGRMAQQNKKSPPRSEFGTYNKMRDMIDARQKMKQRKMDMEKDKQRIKEKKKGIPVKKGGMMKYNKGGGADTGKMGEIKSRVSTFSDRLRKFLKEKRRPKPPTRKPMIPLKVSKEIGMGRNLLPGSLGGQKLAKRLTNKKMGGGMMQRPMAYKMGGGLTAATKRLKAQGYKKGGEPSKKKPIIKITIGVGKAKNFPGMKKLMEMNKKGKKNF